MEKKTRYNQALFLLRAGEHTVSNILNAKTIFQSLGDFADCAEKVKECNDLLNDQVLAKAERLIQTGTLYNLNAAITDLQKLNGYKSANALIAVAEKELLQIRQKEAADAAKRKKQIRYLSAGIGGLVRIPDKKRIVRFQILLDKKIELQITDEMELLTVHCQVTAHNSIPRTTPEPSRHYVNETIQNLERLNTLYQSGAISQEEYNKLKTEVIQGN